MPSNGPGRSRPVIDNLILIAVVVCLGIALVRITLVVVSVPYAAYVNRREAAKATGMPAVRVRLEQRVADSWPFASWWGGRRVPFREGGDYLGVISRNSASRALGCLIGVLAERYRKDGVAVNRIIIPSDRIALYGEEPGTPMTLADGTEVRTSWGSVSGDSAQFSEALVLKEDYDPVLTAEQASRLDATAALAEPSRDFYIGAPRSGGSGDWILLVRQGERREYLLVPLELSPIGVTL